MIKKSICAVVFGLLGNGLFGQDFIANQWWLQRELFNPAASGIDTKLSTAIGGRIGGYAEPSVFFGNNYYGRIDGKLSSINSGIGFSYFTQNPEYLLDSVTNYLTRQRFALNYNYQFTLANNAVLALGFSADVIHNYWNLNWLPPDNPNDPFLPPQNGAGSDVNLGFGVMYQAKNWHIGISMMPSINLIDEVNLSYPFQVYYLTSAVKAHFNDHFAVEGGLLFAIDEDSYYLFNPNLKLWLNDAHYLGVAVSRGDFFWESNDLLLGLTLWKHWSIHYTYSFLQSDSFRPPSNSHTIGLQFALAD